MSGLVLLAAVAIGAWLLARGRRGYCLPWMHDLTWVEEDGERMQQCVLCGKHVHPPQAVVHPNGLF